jgi:hypothetical protein
MKQTIAYIIVVLFMALLPYASHAFRDHWFDLGTEIEKMTYTLSENMNSSLTGERAENFELSAVMIKIHGKLGIEVPWIAGVKIVPEIEIAVENKQ